MRWLVSERFLAMLTSAQAEQLLFDTEGTATSTEAVCAYLLEKGWRQQPYPNQETRSFLEPGESGSPLLVLVPAERATADGKRALLGALNVLRESAGVSAYALLRQIRQRREQKIGAADLAALSEHWERGEGVVIKVTVVMPEDQVDEDAVERELEKGGVDTVPYQRNKQRAVYAGTVECEEELGHLVAYPPVVRIELMPSLGFA